MHLPSSCTGPPCCTGPVPHTYHRTYSSIYLSIRDAGFAQPLALSAWKGKASIAIMVGPKSLTRRATGGKAEGVAWAPGRETPC